MRQFSVASPMDVAWKHGVNSLDALADAAAGGGGGVFVEADVSFGSGATGATGAFMAHPPQTSGPPLAAWLAQASALNASVRAIKLDFKAPAACASLAQALSLSLFAVSPGALWLNADILQGPRGSPPVFDAAAFVAACAALTRRGAVLSVGWTTGPVAADADADDLGYSPTMVDAMLAVCRSHNLLTAQVTFPVRACDALASVGEMRRLLEASNQWSLTIWHGKEGVTAEQELQIRNTFDPQRTFLDIYEVIE
ncbi:hypothetical protein BDR26DRAFT_952949 [Obelidium mucronatum]|nr:hypothetical protein BDR26DRAFT_952949 [Obelidium mucronatum]